MDGDKKDVDPEAILVARQRFYSPEYLFAKQPVGGAVIINISNFTPEKKFKPRRNNSEVDGVHMKETLKMLGFEIENLNMLEDPDNNTIEQKLKEIAKLINKEPDKHEAFCCVIMSYGGDGYFYDKNHQPVLLSEIMKLFNAQNCPGLVLKPKMFIMQACDRSEQELMDPSKFGYKPEKYEGEVEVHRVPTEADFLLYYCLFSGIHYQSVTDKKDCGTPMIESLRNIITNWNRDSKIDFIKALIQVNRQVDSHIDELYNQRIPDCKKNKYKDKKLPLCLSQLTKKLIFPKKS